MGTPTNKLTGIVAGEYGETILMTLVDSNGVAVNVSSYNGTKKVHARSPDDRKTVSATVAFATDGINGQVTFSFANGDIDRAGVWHGQFELKNNPVTKIGRSKVFDMDVEKGIPEA